MTFGPKIWIVAPYHWVEHQQPHFLSTFLQKVSTRSFHFLAQEHLEDQYIVSFHCLESISTIYNFNNLIDVE